MCYCMYDHSDEVMYLSKIYAGLFSNENVFKSELFVHNNIQDRVLHYNIFKLKVSDISFYFDKLV